MTIALLAYRMLTFRKQNYCYMGNFTIRCPKSVSRTLKNERLQNCVLYALTERVSSLIKSPKISRLNLENLLRYLHSSICPIINTYLFVQERTFFDGKQTTNLHTQISFKLVFNFFKQFCDSYRKKRQVSHGIFFFKKFFE